MAFRAEAGTFASPLATGNQTVSLDSSIWEGTSPKVVFLSCGLLSPDVINTSSHFSLGFLTESGQMAIGVYSRNNQATSHTYRRHSDGACCTAITTDGALFLEGQSGSLGANNFIIDWTTVSVEELVVNYLALGGDTLSDVHCKEILSPGGSGEVSYSGVGFQPDALFVLGIDATGVPPMTTTGLSANLGFSDDSTDWYNTALSEHGVSTSDTYRSQGSGVIYHGIDFAGSDVSVASLVSLDADGFTFDWNQSDASGTYFWVLSLKGPEITVIVDTQKPSVGSKSSNLGLVGRAAILSSFMGEASDTVAENARLAVGFLDKNLHQCSCGFLDEDGQATIDSDRYQDSNEVLKSFDHSQNLKAAATASFSGRRLIMNWTIADNIIREFGGLVLGSLRLIDIGGEPVIHCIDGSTNANDNDGVLSVDKFGNTQRIESSFSDHDITALDSRLQDRVDSPQYYSS